MTQRVIVLVYDGDGLSVMQGSTEQDAVVSDAEPHGYQPGEDPAGAHFRTRVAIAWDGAGYQYLHGRVDRFEIVTEPGVGHPVFRLRD